jgi:formyltetrahydrofolate deformylase
MSNVIHRQYILTISCADVRGIVASVTGFIAERDGFILESTQYGDPSTARFFLRIHFSCGAATPEDAVLRSLFAERVGTPFSMRWHLHDVARRPRVVILVSRFSHCLNDLLHRHRSGTLKVEIPAVLSNHPDLRELVEWHKIPFHHLPVTAERKAAQEAELLRIIAAAEADLVVLARYMQVLSPALCTALEGRCINIHHSFLPSFKGAKPYHQAHARGVKIIGATAHYVTENLDEGPIIEQEVARVDHTYTPEELVAVGQDIENRVLARAVHLHAEHRVLQNGMKTVVFR